MTKISNDRRIAKKLFDKHKMFKDDPIAWTAWKMAFHLGMKHERNTAKPNVSGEKLNSYHIETKDGTGSFNFFTQGNDHKEALSQLQTNSSDFKNIVKSNRDLIITVKKI